MRLPVLDKCLRPVLLPEGGVARAEMHSGHSGILSADWLDTRAVQIFVHREKCSTSLR